MILLDGMMQLYRCNYKLSELITRKGQPTGMEYGFLKGLEAFRRFWKDEIIVCWEGKNNFRYKIDPEYKANRRQKRKKEAHTFMTRERIEKFKELLNMVAETAFDNELEADDVMASLATRYAKTEDVVIYSGDKDMFQILQNRPFKIHQCREYQHRERLWTPARIEEKCFGLTPQQLTIWMAFTGDTVDNISGAYKVRRPIIAAAIRSGCTPEEVLNYELFSTKEIFALEEHYNSGRFHQNLKLVTLVIKEDIPVIERDWQPKLIGDWLNKMEFRTLKLCHQCGLETNAIREDAEF